MHGIVSRFVVVAAATAMVACGKKPDAPVVPGEYGKEDAKCFAGIVRQVDGRKISPAVFQEWKNKLDGKNQEWMTGFSTFYSETTNVVKANLGKSPEELRKTGLITGQQLEVITGYLAVSMEGDAAKAEALSASACASVGFTKLADLK